MWVFLESEKHTTWTVGFYDPHGNWITDSDHGSKEDAAKRVNYLNGGTDIAMLRNQMSAVGMALWSK